MKYSYRKKFKLLGYFDSDCIGSMDGKKNTTSFCLIFSSNQQAQINVDNQATIIVNSKDLIFHGNPKKYEIKLYYLREEHNYGERIEQCIVNNLHDIYTIYV